VTPAGPRVPQPYELVIRPRSAISLADVTDAWRYRELLWTLTSRDVRVRYKQAMFGVLWALIQPLAQMLLFTVVFHRLAGINADLPVPYTLFCFSGIVIWSLFSNGLAQSSSSLVENSRIITKVYFPRVLIPLSSILVAGVDFLIGFALVLIAMVGYGEFPHLTILWSPLLAVLALACALSVGLWTSAINVQFRDVRYALPFVLQLLIYITPVFYPSSLIPENYRYLLSLNPMSAIVDGFRAALFDTAMPWARLGGAVAWIAVVGVSGFLYFRRMETSFADRV
jgi:homopolymeric O-antigen transport system permease protein